MRRTPEEHRDIMIALSKISNNTNLWDAAEVASRVISNGGGVDDICRETGLTYEQLEAFMKAGESKTAPAAFSNLLANIMISINRVSGVFLSQKKKTGYVYFVYDTALGMVKIGIAGNYKGRFDALQTACPQKLVLLAIIESANYAKIEKELHEKFSEFRYRGEWFKITESDIDEVIRYHGGRYLASWNG